MPMPPGVERAQAVGRLMVNYLYDLAPRRILHDRFVRAASCFARALALL